MTRARVAAAIAAIVTSLLLQATLVGPVFEPWAVSLPALVVGAVGLVDGPATGMSFGFSAGLVADLASRHPAGLLALCWLGVGLLCGLVGHHGRLTLDAITVGATAAVAGTAAVLVLTVIDRGGTVRTAALGLLPSAVVGIVLAAGVVTVTRRMLYSENLRAPHPVYTELVLGPAGAARDR